MSRSAIFLINAYFMQRISYSLAQGLIEHSGCMVAFSQVNLQILTRRNKEKIVSSQFQTYIVIVLFVRRLTFKLNLRLNLLLAFL